jgi:Zn-dependent oligopeptidase
MTEQLTDNPLLIERFPIQFETVKAEHVEPAIQLLLEQMNQRLVALGGPDTPRTYQDILLVLE